MILMAEIGSNTNVKMSMLIDDENVRYVRYDFNLDNHDVLDLDELKFLKYFGSAHPTTLRENYGITKMRVTLPVPFMISLQILHGDIRIARNACREGIPNDVDFGDIETDILHLINVAFLNENDDVLTEVSNGYFPSAGNSNFYLSEAKMIQNISTDDPVLMFKVVDAGDRDSYFSLRYDLNYP